MGSLSGAAARTGILRKQRIIKNSKKGKDVCEIKTHNAVCSKREEYEIIGFYKNRVR